MAKSEAKLSTDSVHYEGLTIVDDTCKANKIANIKVPIFSHCVKLILNKKPSSGTSMLTRYM